MIEAVRDYWNARPCNVRHGTSRMGTPAWSQEVRERKYFVEPHVPGFADFPRWKGKRVLEIGCGIGTETAEFVKHGAVVDAMDLSEESIRWARMRSSARFYVADAESRVPTGPYDLVFAFGVLHHTPNPKKILWNVHACLKPDGELRLMLYAKWSLKHLLKEQPEAQAGCPIARMYTMKQARELLENTGFDVVSMRKTHIFPWRVSDYIQHRYVKRWYFRFMPERCFRWLKTVLGHHLLIVARKA
jgi:SAM-dependent methyltransferase